MRLFPVLFATWLLSSSLNEDASFQLKFWTISKSYSGVIVLPFCSLHPNTYSIHLYFFPPFFFPQLHLPAARCSDLDDRGTARDPSSPCMEVCVCVHVCPEATSNPLWQKDIRPLKYVGDRCNTLPITVSPMHTHSKTLTSCVKVTLEKQKEKSLDSSVMEGEDDRHL